MAATTIPGMGQYEAIRPEKLLHHTKALQQQVQEDTFRKIAEKSNEKELDKLRAECQSLELAGYLQTQQRYRENIQNALKDACQTASMEKECKMMAETREKQMEYTDRKESEAKYKQYMDSYLKERTALRVQLAVQLQEQIKEKEDEKRGRNYTGYQTVSTQRKDQGRTMCEGCFRYVPERYLSPRSALKSSRKPPQPQ